MFNKKLTSKVLIYIFLSFFTFFFLSGCEGYQLEEIQPQEVEEELNEVGSGTFTGYSTATDNGYAWAKVKVQGDNITDVQLMEILSTGNEKDYDTYKYEPAVKAREEMAERFVDADSAEVDVYTSATDSSEKYKEAVARALDYSKMNYSNAVEDENTYYDGTYQGSSERTEYGYAVALVTIKDDDITVVEVKEAGGEGEWKDFDIYEWEAAVEAHEEMPERFVEADSIDVDLYTNATQSSIRYKEAVRNALRHARRNPEQDLE